MNKIGLVYWSRHFPKYMQKVVREYLTDKPSIRAEYMEYSREAQVQQKQRRELMYSTHQMTGPLLDRKDKEQFVFQTYSDHLPWIENKNYPEYEIPFEDVIMECAQRIADTGKIIDFWWSGGVDSTSALTAFNEICPKQLHVIIGKHTEYPEYYDRLVKHLDHSVNESNNVLGKDANPKEHILCTAMCADLLFGGSNWNEEEGDESWNKAKDGWEAKRQYKLAASSWKFISEFQGNKLDIDNYMPIYILEPMEKWAINKWRRDEIIFFNSDQTSKKHYLKCKMYMRDYLSKYHPDWYAYGKNKEISLPRAQALPNYGATTYKTRIWAITQDGDIIHEDNIKEYNWRDFLHQYKEEWY